MGILIQDCRYSSEKWKMTNSKWKMENKHRKQI